MLKILALISALFIQVGYAGPAPKLPNAKTFEQAEGTVEWHAIGSPGFLKIDGKGGKVEGPVMMNADGKITAHFTVDMTAFTTGMSLRDKHMRDKYLEVGKFKDAFFDLDPWTLTADSSQFKGKLTIKDVAKPVFGTAVYREGTLKAEMEIHLSDWPIGVPSHLGVTVAEDVTVNVTIPIDVGAIPAAPKARKK